MDSKYENEIRELIHSLRNPLTAIMSNLELINHGYLGDVSEEIKEIINETVFNVKYLDILMKNAGDIVKIKNKEELLLSQINLSAVIKQILKDISIIYKDYSNLIQVNYKKEEISLNINDDFIHRFFLILIIELLKFSGEDNKLFINFNEVNEQVVCNIQFTNIEKDLFNFEEVFTELFIDPKQKANRLNYNFYKKFLDFYDGNIIIKKEDSINVLEIKFKCDNSK